jgi:hypothetical protein
MIRCPEARATTTFTAKMAMTLSSEVRVMTLSTVGMVLIKFMAGMATMH